MVTSEFWLKLILGILGLAGLWSSIFKWIDTKKEKNDAEREMVLGLGHFEIIDRCDRYIEQGWISSAEFDDLEKYLFKPHAKLGGDGSAERAFNKVRQLPSSPPISIPNE